MAHLPDSSTQVPGPSRRGNIDKLELFPVLSAEVPARTLYKYTNLKDLYGQVDIHPIIPYMDKIVYRVYIKKIEWTDQVVKNLNTLAKDAGGEIMEDRVKSWDRIAETLSSEKKSSVNLDRRLSYVFNNHYFLTKSGFTFGLRTVSEGTVHLYQITTRRLHFYYQPKDGRYRFKMVERILPVEEHRKYRHIILRSHTAYRVTAGTSYVLIVSQKSYFSLHVLPDTMQLPFPTVDPIQEYRAIQRERRRAFQYNIPPPTPNLLERPEEPVFQVPQQRYNIPPPTPNLLEEPIFQVPQQPEEDLPPAYEDLYPVDPELHQELEPQPREPEPQPEPQQPLQPEPQPAFCIFNYAIDRYVNIVSPQLLKWYYSLKQTLGPIDFLTNPLLEEAGPFQTEPLDLCTRPAAQAASTGRPATRPNDTGEGLRPATEGELSGPAAQPSSIRPAAQPSSIRPAAQPSSTRPAAQPSKLRSAAQLSEDGLSGPAVQPSSTRPSGLKRSSTESTKKKNKKKRTPSEELERLIFPELEELDQVLSQEYPDTAQVFEDLCKITCNIDC